MQAIAAAVKGGSFIIQGPPGTGKSQTIANVIAQCLANGKTVLFVKLQQLPRQVSISAESCPDCSLLPRVLQPPVPTNSSALSSWVGSGQRIRQDGSNRWSSTLFSELADVRSQLNAYGEAILRSREPLGTSCYEVYGRLAGLADAPDVFFDLSDPLTHSDEELRRRVGMVRRLQANSRAFLDGDAHPWGGNRPSNASPRSPSRDPVPTVAPGCRGAGGRGERGGTGDVSRRAGAVHSCRPSLGGRDGAARASWLRRASVVVPSAVARAVHAGGGGARANVGKIPRPVGGDPRTLPAQCDGP